VHRPLLNVNRVAARLKVSPKTVRMLITTGQLKAINLGTQKAKVYRIREAFLEAFLSARSVTGIEGEGDAPGVK